MTSSTESIKQIFDEYQKFVKGVTKIGHVGSRICLVLSTIAGISLGMTYSMNDEFLIMISGMIFGFGLGGMVLLRMILEKVDEFLDNTKKIKVDSNDIPSKEESKI